MDIHNLLVLRGAPKWYLRKFGYVPAPVRYKNVCSYNFALYPGTKLVPKAEKEIAKILKFLGRFLECWKIAKRDC